MKRLRDTKPTWLFFFIICLAAMVILVASFNLAARRKKFNTQRDIAAEAASQRQWAVALEMPGVKNFHKVSDQLYRGAQPTAEGMVKLKNMGVKTIVSLRSVHSDRDEIGRTDLRYEHIEMKPWEPKDQKVVRFLKIATDPNSTPVFVHCKRGADRTGTMVAAYRVVVQGWPKEHAILEMTKGGFNYYPGFESLVEYIQNLDTEKIKSQAGLESKTVRMAPN